MMATKATRAFVVAIAVGFVVCVLLTLLGVVLSTNPGVYYTFAAGVGVAFAVVVELVLELRARKSQPQKPQRSGEQTGTGGKP
jgi:uncharacterized membrane protein